MLLFISQDNHRIFRIPTIFRDIRRRCVCGQICDWGRCCNGSIPVRCVHWNSASGSRCHNWSIAWSFGKTTADDLLVDFDGDLHVRLGILLEISVGRTVRMDSSHTHSHLRIHQHIWPVDHSVCHERRNFPAKISRLLLWHYNRRNVRHLLCVRQTVSVDDQRLGQFECVSLLWHLFVAQRSVCAFHCTGNEGKDTGRNWNYVQISLRGQYSTGRLISLMSNKMK